jgi:hypothetical protein
MTVASAPALVPALATGIESLLREDARDAAPVVLRHHRRLPAAPQLAARTCVLRLAKEVADRVQDQAAVRLTLGA